MNEYDLLRAIGDINEKYIENAVVEEDTKVDSVKATPNVPGRGKRKRSIYIAVIVVILTTTSLAFAYYENQKERERIVSEQSNERAIVTIPEGITKIQIVDGTRGDVLTLDEESVAEFFTKINSVPGTVEYVGEGSGYQYAVHCYRGDERVLAFVFLNEKIIKENMGDGTDRRFTSEDTIPAFPYIQGLFEKEKAKK